MAGDRKRSSWVRTKGPRPAANSVGSAFPRLVTIGDPNGRELPDVDAAKNEARRIGRELLQAGHPPTASILVTDGRRMVFEIRLSECDG